MKSSRLVSNFFGIIFQDVINKISVAILAECSTLDACYASCILLDSCSTFDVSDTNKEYDDISWCVISHAIDIDFEFSLFQLYTYRINANWIVQFNVSAIIPVLPIQINLYQLFGVMMFLIDLWAFFKYQVWMYFL